MRRPGLFFDAVCLAEGFDPVDFWGENGCLIDDAMAAYDRDSDHVDFMELMSVDFFLCGR